jgi:hypothetical protein
VTKGVKRVKEKISEQPEDPKGAVFILPDRSGPCTSRKLVTVSKHRSCKKDIQLASEQGKRRLASLQARM